MENGTATAENSLAASQKVKKLPYDPVIALLDIHPREGRTYVHSRTCTCMFTAAFSVKRPSADEWINKDVVHPLGEISLSREQE